MAAPPQRGSAPAAGWGVPIGVGLGATIGLLVGGLLGQVALGLVFGASFGLVVGAVAPTARMVPVERRAGVTAVAVAIVVVGLVATVALALG